MTEYRNRVAQLAGAQFTAFVAFKLHRSSVRLLRLNQQQASNQTPETNHGNTRFTLLKCIESK